MSASPDTLPSRPSSPNREPTPSNIYEKTPLYQSLLAAVEMPLSAKPKWLETVADFSNNPRTIPRPPYNDGMFHFVSNNGDVLGIGFPAVLDLHGKYGRLGPYFNMATEQGVNLKVRKRFPLQSQH